MNLLFSPHSDDSVLFASFTILREKPLVVTIFDSYVQEKRGNPVTAEQRRAEDRAAMAILGAEVVFMGLSDAEPSVPQVWKLMEHYAIGCDHIYAPLPEKGGHEQHNMVGEIAKQLFRDKVTYYTTYTTSGKSKGVEVPIEDPAWIGKKLRALACYESQWAPKLGCWPHFLRSQMEYYG